MRWPPIFIIFGCLWALPACSKDSVEIANEVVLIEESVQFRSTFNECREKGFREPATRCYRKALEEYDGEVIVSFAPGLPGFPGEHEIYVQDAVGILRDMVEQCKLGHTLLSYATDGVASLNFSRLGLGEDQLACIRSYERPGLFLNEATTS